MGAAGSVPTPMAHWSKDEVYTAVNALGPTYHELAERLYANGVAGSQLGDMKEANLVAFGCALTTEQIKTLQAHVLTLRLMVTDYSPNSSPYGSPQTAAGSHFPQR